MSTFSVVEYPVVPDHGFVVPPSVAPLNEEEKQALGMRLSELQGRTGLQGFTLHFVARQLIHSIGKNQLDRSDAQAMTAAAAAVSVPEMPPRPSYQGKIRPHVIERYQLRVNPNVGAEQAFWEIRALLTNSTVTETAPDWVYGSLLTASPPFVYRMASEDIAFAVTAIRGTVHMVVTRQGQLLSSSYNKRPKELMV